MHLLDVIGDADVAAVQISASSNRAYLSYVKWSDFCGGTRNGFTRGISFNTPASIA